MSWGGLAYDWGGFNVVLFQYINGHTPDWLDGAAWLGGFLGSYLWGFAVMAALWFAILRHRSAGLLQYSEHTAAHLRRVVLVFALAFLLTASMKFQLDFPRPLTVLGESVHIIGESEWRYSLPSGHSTFTALVLALLWPLVSWRLRALLILYVLWVGWSRIAAGAHFPADVLCGWLVGAASVLVVSRLTRAVDTQDNRNSSRLGT